MGIYEGYQKFKRKNGLIAYTDDKLYAGVLIDGFLQIVTGDESYIIEIRMDRSVKNQIITIFHELLHLSKKYSLARYDSAFFGHSLLEEEAKTVYNCQPNLVKHMRKKLKSLIKLLKRRRLREKVINNLNDIKDFSTLENRVEAIGAPKDDPLYIRLSDLRKLRGDSRILFLSKMQTDIIDLEKRIMKEDRYNKLLSASDKDLVLEYGIIASDEDYFALKYGISNW